ncbi:adenylate/guanylate cyclase domain-containing protein [Leptolyngbya sp. FACHB-671]|uniref:adenylate/guanylate cyclase domain-containing protein n=1 Tax=Leptolyngbya sp. FACHB-671 TaxID=2692812 RepID=UPI001685F70B|nr:adenylate/guanylate cyclase domain-containing protein [Leptolyngbya sp. FACHB-671]MBD2066491.1 adenylate/guanylate cyclase domain-containing protein [Leptolyngbya sp. FACHB-671]
MMTRLWNGFMQLLLKQIVLVLTVMFCIGVGVALSNMFQLSSNLIRSQAVLNATLYIQAFNQAITLYSDAAADPAKESGLTVTHAYVTEEQAIPLPSTFAIELSDMISDRNPDLSVRFFSDYPFPWRQSEGGIRDEFEQASLDFLRQSPREKFVRFEERDGHTTMRYGEASIMKATCVACHNTHPQSPKTDWELGDVAGVWEIKQPLDTFVQKVNTDLRETFFMLGGISVLGLSGLTLVVGKLRDTAKGLEGRVKERTADLAQANDDLEKRNQLIRQVFGRYLSDEVVVNLLESPGGLKLGGDRRKITILTSDLRGFTSLSERLSPEEVINILNLYLEYMADVINQYHGTIDEFMGDGILVLFGAPKAREDDAIRAIACACAMQLAMGAVNEHMKVLGLPRLEMGIGINTGEVVVGNIGSEKRTKYGIVGSQVNLTYRIESYTRGGQILISEQTFKEAGPNVRISGQQQVQPKGVKQPITIYEVYGISGFHNLYLPKEEEVFLPLPKPVPLQFSLLEGKEVSKTHLQGNLVQLSATGAQIRVTTPNSISSINEFANLKLTLLASNPAQNLNDIYAKVAKTQASQDAFSIYFTSMPPHVQTWLTNLYQSCTR